MLSARLLKDVLEGRVGGSRTVFFDGFGEGVTEEREVGVVDHLELVAPTEDTGKQPSAGHDQVEEECK